VATLPAAQAEPATLAFEITVERCAREHAGLGTGTQLALAVAKALARLTGLCHEEAPALARRVGRGLRSGLGVHGFARGGFLIDAGKSNNTAIAPLVARHDFPPEWRVLLIVPRGVHGEHGSRETEAFAHIALTDGNLARTDGLCRLALLGMLPAVVERDLEAFGEALHEFNRRAGEWFAKWQGGAYSHPRVASLIAALRREGVRGVGQSSWGPAVFAIADEERLRNLRGWMIAGRHATADEIELCSAANVGVPA
jgi:beta-RFAP synthase